MDDPHVAKDTIDLLAASTGILSMASYLPPMASIFTIVWLGIRIYESPTVQAIVHRRRPKK